MVTYAFPTAGVHTVQIKVTENSGGVDIATADIVVNAAPTALIRFSPAQPYTGDVVQFASLSRDPDGYLASETWDLDGDGQYDDARGKLASRAFTTVGAHTVRLRAVDGSGAERGPGRHAERARPSGRRRRRRPSSSTRPCGSRAARARARRSSPAWACGPRRAPWSRPCARARAVRARAHPAPARAARQCACAGSSGGLPAGTRIRIYVTAKGKIGSYTSLLIRRSKRPSRRDLCLAPGTTRAIQMPLMRLGARTGSSPTSGPGARARARRAPRRPRGLHDRAAPVANPASRSPSPRAHADELPAHRRRALPVHGRTTRTSGHDCRPVRPPPSFTYATAGVKTITMQVEFSVGDDEVREHTVRINAAPVARFTFAPDRAQRRPVGALRCRHHERRRRRLSRTAPSSGTSTTTAAMRQSAR